MKICKDCIYIEVKKFESKPDTYDCKICEEVIENLVTGDHTTVTRSCEFSRGQTSKCGPDGKLFEVRK